MHVQLGSVRVQFNGMLAYLVNVLPQLSGVRMKLENMQAQLCLKSRLEQ
jgi:hypothetical protein